MEWNNSTSTQDIFIKNQNAKRPTSRAVVPVPDVGEGSKEQPGLLLPQAGYSHQDQQDLLVQAQAAWSFTIRPAQI